MKLTQLKKKIVNLPPKFQGTVLVLRKPPKMKCICFKQFSDRTYIYIYFSGFCLFSLFFRSYYRGQPEDTELCILSKILYMCQFKIIIIIIIIIMTVTVKMKKYEIETK